MALSIRIQTTIAFLIVGLLPIGALGFAAHGEVISHERDRALDYNTALAGVASETVTTLLEAVIGPLEVYARSFPLLEALSPPAPDLDRVNGTLNSLRASSALIETTFVTNRSAYAIAFSPQEGLQNVAGRDLSIREWYRGTFGCGCTYITGGYQGLVYTGTHAAVGSPVIDPSGRQEYILVATVNASELKSRLGEISLPLRSWVMIVDQHGIVLQHKNESAVQALVNVSSLPWVAAAQRSGAYTSVDGIWLEGDEVAVSAVRNPLSGWTVAVVTPLVTIDEVAYALGVQILLYTVLGATFAAGVAVYLGGRVTRPIVKLARAARQIEEGGPVEIMVDGSQEMDELQAAFKSMALSLTTRLKENEKLLGDLERAQKIREELLDVVGHELRTPVTVIQGYSEILAGHGETLSAERRTELVIRLKSASRNLSTLITSFVELSKYRAGALQLRIAEFSLRDLIEDLVDLQRARRQTAAREITIDVRPPELTVRADRAKLLIALEHLIDNANKFSPPGKDVDVRAWREQHFTRVSVKDQGPGIPAEVLARGFEAFVQADASSTRRVGGVGLGLAVAGAMIAAHRGVLEFDTSPERGTVVTVSLPRDDSEPGGQGRGDAGVPGQPAERGEAGRAA